MVILQIPAFLCRQTDLLLAAAPDWGASSTSRKAGLWLPAGYVPCAISGRGTANDRVLLTEQAPLSGYNNLIL